MRSRCLIVLLAVSLAGCSQSPNESKVIRDTGTVQYVDLEGGFYAIVGDGGGHYDPTNLPAWAQEDGLRVRFVARTVGGASVHMWGTLVHLESLEGAR
jgi:hypothetical protein